MNGEQKMPKRIGTAIAAAPLAFRAGRFLSANPGVYMGLGRIKGL